MVEVVDNFLDPNHLQQLKMAVFGGAFPWYMQKSVAYDDESMENDNLYMLAHGVYKNSEVASKDMFEFIKGAVFPKLDMIAPLRIKINQYPYTEKLYEHPLHYDQKYSNKALVLCLNTCNGYTHFENGDKVDSVENRAIFFDGSKLHGSTNCSDQKCRIVLAMNYV